MGKKRGGFTFIELVVAIIVMSIAIMSVPLLLSQTSKSDEFSISQEAILAGATKIGNILTYPWDDKLVGSLSVKHILDVTNGDSELDRYPDTNSTTRIGNFKTSFRRKYDANQTFASLTLGRAGDTNTTVYNDLDDFNGTVQTITSGGVGDYIKDFNLTTTIKYISDSANYSLTTLNFGELNSSSSTPSTNLKMIEVKVTDPNSNEEITTLRAFSANIGSYELIYRIFP